MSKESRLWLTAAGVVAVTILVIVVVFGITSAPSFPSLYDGGPIVEGTVAYMDYGRDECVDVLDVATGESRELYCADWMWIEGWDRDGNLRVQGGNGFDHVTVLDPETGAVIATGGSTQGPAPDYADLETTSRDGRTTLTYTGDGNSRVLIDVEGPRNYAFWSYGITVDDRYAWVCDSSDRLLLVALDGSSGPWLVAADVPDASWYG